MSDELILYIRSLLQTAVDYEAKAILNEADRIAMDKTPTCSLIEGKEYARVRRLQEDFINFVEPQVKGGGDDV